MYAAGWQRVKVFAAVFVLVIFLVPFRPVSGQEIFVNGGLVSRADRGTSTRGHWSVAYFQHLTEHATVSASYINEGHQSEHDRDGIAFQIWGRGTPLGPSVSFAGGVGPYFFSDTREGASGCSCEIQHGLGAIFSGAITWYARSPFLLQARGNYIGGSNGFNTLSASIGIGYLLGDEGRGSFPPGGHSTENEVGLFMGGTALNCDHSSALSVGVEYRRNLSPDFDWTVAWLHEGDRRPVGRYGVMSEVWAVRTFYGDRLGLGIGAGAYLARDKYGRDDSGARDDVNAVISLTAVWWFTPRLGLRTVFHRIATDHDRDADVLVGGLAISF